MEGVNRLARSPKFIGESRVLKRDPMTLIDVGCSGGIDQVWRDFGDDLVAHGFDPQRSECERLQAAETNPRVTYHSSFVGLPSDHPFKRHCQNQKPQLPIDLHPWNRLSVVAAQKLAPARPEQANPTGQDLVSTNVRTGVAEFVESHGLDSVDFVKIDVDGPDLEVLVSAEPVFGSHQVLGCCLEVNYTGSHYDTENSFHNMDRRMRESGFFLADLQVRHYSRTALPAPFMITIPAQTRFGQPLQGDVTYFRDVSGDSDQRLWGAPLSPTKLLKIIALYDVFNLPDMAAETVLSFREQLATLIDTEKLLDALTPPFKGRQLSYRNYVNTFQTDLDQFFPAGFVPDPQRIAQLETENRGLRENLARLQEKLKNDS